jgi:hypothetical protein
MLKNIPYAHLKTIDGEEVKEYSKDRFEKVIKDIPHRVSEKSDRTLYFVTENVHVHGTKFYYEDYFEVLNNRH